MNLAACSFRIFCQHFKKLSSYKRYKSKRRTEDGVAASNAVKEEDEIYICTAPVPSPIDQSKVEEPPVFDRTLITHLERLSLVRFSDEQAISKLKQSIRYANQLKLIDTTGVKPLETILEDMPCPLREDIEEKPLSTDEVFMNAAVISEDYFVTPPGNIPLEEMDRFDLSKVGQCDQSEIKENSV